MPLQSLIFLTVTFIVRGMSWKGPEPVFLNVYGAQESIPRNEFASLCSQAGRYDNPIPPRFLAPIDSLKIPAQLLIYGTTLTIIFYLKKKRKNCFHDISCTVHAERVPAIDGGHTGHIPSVKDI
jgi:hypothetical protein